MAKQDQRFRCALCSFTGSAYELGVHLVKEHKVDVKTAVLGLREASRKMGVDVEEDLRRLMNEFSSSRPSEKLVEVAPPRRPPSPPPPPSEPKLVGLLDIKSMCRALNDPSIALLKQIRSDGGSDKFILVEDESRYNRSLIEYLHRAGFIEWSVSGRVLRCPRCLSRKVSVFYSCPYCKSRSVNKGTLYTHQACGAFFTEPVVKEGKTYCPNCGAELKGDYSIVGAWFECESCGRGFENPDINFKCNDCLLDFDVQASRYDRVLSVKLSDRAKILLTALDLLDVVSKVASEKGYQVQLFSTIKGVSGVEHDFDAVLTKDGQLIATSLLLMGGGEDIFYSLAPILAKSYDLPENAEMLLVTNNMKLGPEVQQLLKRYRLRLVQGSNAEELSASMRANLESLERAGG